MRLQIEVKRELFTALLALVWLFTGVHKHVTLQLGVVEESLLTADVHALK